MKQRTIILYDLQGKAQTEKVQALRKLYGYRDKSNYSYKYDRTGELSNVEFTKQKKMVLELKDSKDLAKVIEILGKLKIKAEVAKIQ
jgi:hypothetical protein